VEVSAHQTELFVTLPSFLRLGHIDHLLDARHSRMAREEVCIPGYHFHSMCSKIVIDIIDRLENYRRVQAPVPGNLQEPWNVTWKLINLFCDGQV